MYVEIIKEALLKLAKKDMPHFTEQNRPKKVKEIYEALEREHPNMPAEVKARIASRKGSPDKAERSPGPPYSAPLHYKRSKGRYVKKSVDATSHEISVRMVTDLLREILKLRGKDQKPPRVSLLLGIDTDPWPSVYNEKT